MRGFADSESSGLKSAADDVFDVFRKGADAATQDGFRHHSSCDW